MRSKDKNLIVKTIFWHLSLYKKAFSLAPIKTAQTVFISVVSRILHLLSFLLPLKAIMVAGSTNPPAFVVDMYPDITVSSLVLFLGAVTVIFYLINITLLRLLDTINDSGAQRIIMRTQKVGGTRDVYSETRRYYEKIIKSLSGLFFVASVLLALLLLYQKLFLVFIIALIVPWLIVILIFQNPDGNLQSWLARGRIVLQQRWMFVVFISTFVIIVLDVINENFESSILLAMVGFILCRHALSATNEFINIGFNLYSLREKVNSLLFFEAPLVYSRFSEYQYRDLLLTNERIEFIARDIVHRLESGDSSERVDVHWQSLQVYGVYFFSVIPSSNQRSLITGDDFLLKVFQPKYKFLANHETLLLGNISSGVKSLPRLIVSDEIDGFDCILLKGSGIPLTTLDEYHSAIITIFSDIWALDTSVDVIKAYTRSHDCGISKLKRSQVESLSLACLEDDHKAILAAFLDKFEAIKQIVLRLPRILHNPELTMNVINKDKDGFPVVLQWGRWCVEPIGTALWYYDFIDDDNLDRIRKTVVDTRKDWSFLEIAHLRLSGELYRLWKLIEKQDLSSAIVSAHRVFEVYQRLVHK